MGIEIEEVSGRHSLGEGPHWDQDQQCLYYVDILESVICRYVPAKKKFTQCKVEQAEVVTIVIPVKGTSDKFIISMDRRLALMTWDGESQTPSDVKVLTSVDDDLPEENVFNDGKTDHTGRLWVGSMINFGHKDLGSHASGFLYSFSETLEATKWESNLIVANGLAWSPDNKFMYYIDTGKNTVDTFDFDATTGEIKNRRVAYDFTGTPGMPARGGPDGMTVDTDGNLWVAVFGVGGVFQINPHTGKLLRVVNVPSPGATSVAFGGPALDELYVTSGCFLLKDRLSEFPSAGKTFRVTGLGVKGLPMLPFDLDKSLL